jgi:hypothetical protein
MTLSYLQAPIKDGWRRLLVEQMQQVRKDEIGSSLEWMVPAPKGSVVSKTIKDMSSVKKHMVAHVPGATAVKVQVVRISVGVVKMSV